MTSPAQQLLATATRTHIENENRQRRLNENWRENAEDRAFDAERSKQRTESELSDEQQEHQITRLALQRVIAQNESMKRSMRHLIQKWAPQENKNPEAMEQEVLQESEVKAQGWIEDPANQHILERAIEQQRDKQRITPKRPKRSP